MIQKTSPKSEIKQEQFVFGKSNYQIMLVGIAVVILGFILMMGDTDIYNFQKIVLAPFVVLIGFAIGFFAILKKTTSTKI